MKFRFKKTEKKQTDERFVENSRKKQRKARKRRVVTPFLIVVSVFIFAAAVYLCLTMLFNVDRIIIEGNTLYEEHALIETSGIEKGDNLFEVDTAYAEDKLYSVYSYIEAVEVKRSFPNAVTVKITEAEPFSVIEEADGYTLVSAGGKVLERGLEEVPGGMLSNLISQLKQNNAEDKYYEVLAEVPRVREDFGFPPLVTPTSQIVGTQAVLNVLSGERYKMITKESKGLLKGEYGQLPAPVNEEVRKKAIGNEEIITVRPADLLEPELPKYTEETKDIAKCEEDILSYALFPQVAKTFFAIISTGHPST